MSEREKQLALLIEQMGYVSTNAGRALFAMTAEFKNVTDEWLLDDLRKLRTKINEFEKRYENGRKMENVEDNA